MRFGLCFTRCGTGFPHRSPANSKMVVNHLPAAIRELNGWSASLCERMQQP